jgi:hypothetical protein
MKMERRIQRRFALLIGVDQYDDPFFQPVSQTTNDVAELEDVLTGYGYEVRTLHSHQEDAGRKPTKANFDAELEKIGNKVRPYDGKHPGDLLWVYFGGHGELDTDRNAYLVTSDSRISMLAETAIDLEEFKEKIVGVNAQARILFLDACHAGIERVREAGGMSPDFERHIFLEAEGTATLAACMSHEAAYHHHITPNGVFTHYLLEGLKGKAAQKDKRFITFDDLRYYVTDKVRTWAEARRKKQTPNASSHLVGDPPLVELEYCKKFCGSPGGTNRSPLPGAFSKESPGRRRQIPDWPRNPFTDTLAIRDPLRFIGRKTENRRLWNYLQDGSVALRGEPKIGKSSMMLHLARQWEGKKIGPINFYQLGSLDDFYKYIARELELESYDWSAICEALDSREVLLLLDELDAAPKRDITHEDMSYFRAVCESNRNFKILAISRAPLKEVFPDTGVGSPFYNLLQPITLKDLNRDDALSLLEHPWAPEASMFDKATCEELLATAGLHPFKLQRAAFHCYENLMDHHYHWKEAFQQDMEQML